MGGGDPHSPRVMTMTKMTMTMTLITLMIDNIDDIAVHHTGGLDGHALLGPRCPGKPGDGQ